MIVAYTKAEAYELIQGLYRQLLLQAGEAEAEAYGLLHSVCTDDTVTTFTSPEQAQAYQRGKQRGRKILREAT